METLDIEVLLANLTQNPAADHVDTSVGSANKNGHLELFLKLVTVTAMTLLQMLFIKLGY